MKHHPFGPSKWDIWANCPGAIKAMEPYPDVSSPAAEEGTVAHALLELSLIIEESPEKSAMGRHLREAYNHILQVASLPEAKLYIERQVELHDASGGVLLFGSADVIVVLPDVLHTMDLKYGHKYVPASSGQLRIYALAAMDTFNIEREKIFTTVLQPRGGGSPIRTEEYTLTEMNEFRQEVYLAFERTQEMEPPRFAGSHCFWCKAWKDCKERRFYDLERDFGPIN